MRKRVRGTGSVRPLRGGWQARLPDAKRTPIGLYASPEEAEAALALALADGVPTPHAITLRNYGDGVMKAREADGVRGIDQEWSVFNTHIATAPFADRAVVALTAADVFEWLRMLTKKPARIVTRTADGSKTKAADHPIGRQTQQHARRLLVGILEQARIDGLVAANVARNVRLPRHLRKGERAPTGTHEWLRPAELEQLIGCADIPEHVRLELAVRACQALRPGEAAGLRWCDVNLDDDEPTVTIALSYDGPVKDDEQRTIPLLAPSVVALERLRELRGDDACTGEQLVFPANNGAMRPQGDDMGWTDKRWRDRRRQLHVTAGWRSIARIDRELSIYGLRHTGATLLAAGAFGCSWDVVELRRFLGHSSSTVTMRYVNAAATLHATARETTAAALVSILERAPKGHGADSETTETPGTPGWTRTTDPRLRRLRRVERSRDHGSARALVVPEGEARAALDAITVARRAMLDGGPHTNARVLDALDAAERVLLELSDLPTVDASREYLSDA